jgi:hypothetical protein
LLQVLAAAAVLGKRLLNYVSRTCLVFILELTIFKVLAVLFVMFKGCQTLEVLQHW